MNLNNSSRISKRSAGQFDPNNWLSEGDGLFASAAKTREFWTNHRQTFSQTVRNRESRKRNCASDWNLLTGLPRASMLLLAYSVEMYLKAGMAKIGYIRDSQQTTRCFRTRNAVVTVPARPNVSMENSGDFCTSASTGSSPWRVRAGLRMDSPWTSPQAATVCTEQGQPQRAGNPL